MTTHVVLWCPPSEIKDASALRADLAGFFDIPEGASPAGALGFACREVRTPRGTELKPARRAGGGSIWFFCDSRKDESGIEIHGDKRIAVEPTGALDFDPGIDPELAKEIRERYDFHRFAMTPAQLGLAVAGEISKRRGIAANRAGAAWLVDGAHADALAEIGSRLARHGATLAIHRLAENDGDLYRPTAQEALRAEIDSVLAAAAKARESWADPARRKRPRESAETNQISALSEAQAKLRQWRDTLRIDLGAIDQQLTATTAAVREAFRAARDGDEPAPPPAAVAPAPAPAVVPEFVPPPPPSEAAALLDW